MVATRDDPIYTFEIHLRDDTWTTVPGVIEFSCARGRQEELGTIEPGRLTIVFDNNSGMWSKLNPANPFNAYGVTHYLMRPCRLYCTYNAVTYWIFSGYIQQWRPVEGSGPTDANMIIDAVDYLYVLQLIKPIISLAAQGDSERVQAVLAYCGYQPGVVEGISADDSVDTVLAATLTGQTTALAHIQDICAGARGVFFQARTGEKIYHNRHHRFVNASGNTSQATFGQANLTTGIYAGGTLKYATGMPVLDDRWIYNIITVDASGVGEVGAATDATSVTYNWPRPLAISAPFMAAGQAQVLAAWLLYVYKDELYRIPALTVRPSVLAEWVQALEREIGDRLTVTITGPGAITFSRDVWIEGMTTSWKSTAGHITTWQLSDTQSQGPTPFRLGLSALNSGHVLIY
jgi:hypothetical protein